MTAGLIAARAARFFAGLLFWAVAFFVGKAYLHALTLTILVTEALLLSVGGILMDLQVFLEVVKALSGACGAIAPALRAALNGAPLPSPPPAAPEQATPEER